MGIMGQVVSSIIRCICGVTEKDDHNWPSPNTSPPNTPFRYKSCTNVALTAPADALQPKTSLDSLTGPSPSDDPIELLKSPLLASFESFTESYPSGSIHEELIVSDQHKDSDSRFLEKKIVIPRWCLGLRCDLSNSDEEEEIEVTPFHRPEVESVRPRWMKQYSSLQKILLVGEGDFSFSACLAVAFGSATNMIATSLNSADYLRSNYGRAMSNIQKLTSRGCKVVHGVDATEMASNVLFKGIKFDRIVFNFPHAGFFPHECPNSVLRRHRNLVKKFLGNAKRMISANGEIHIRHKSNGFFWKWNLEVLGSTEGLRLIEESHFNFREFPGYHTKYGFGGDKNFNCNPSKTYIFGLP